VSYILFIVGAVWFLNCVRIAIRHSHGFSQIEAGDLGIKVLASMGEPTKIFKGQSYAGPALGEGEAEWCYFDPLIGGIQVFSFRIGPDSKVLSKYMYQSP